MIKIDWFQKTKTQIRIDEVLEMKNMKVNNGILEIGGVSVTDLAEKCGTPLFVYDEAELDEKMMTFQKSFQSDIFQTQVIYASKAFTCKAMLTKLNGYGFGLDVVSGGELYLARESGFPMAEIYFHGNNKLPEELRMALELGCGTVIVDNLMECEELISLSKEMKKSVKVIIRVNPGITAHTHKYIITGDLDSKFGVTIHKETMILDMIKKCQENKYTVFQGFHVHIGSQIFDLAAFDAAIEVMVTYLKSMKEKHGVETKILDIGGGFGVRYTNEDEPREIQEVCQRIVKKCESELKKNQLTIEKLMIEPGRSMVAESGCTLYTVGYQKETPNKSYIFIDGGMTDNIRVALYQAKYDCDLANKMDAPKDKLYSVAGKCCESGDILVEGYPLPEAEMNDLLVMYSTGAYGYSMSNNYNRIGKPAVIFAKDGNARLVLKRETYKDQLRFESDEEVIV